MEIYSIGFTKTTAAEFFGRLRTAKIRRLLDVRLNNVSQLAGFAKRDDLAYFVREIVGAEYVHELLLAPNADILDAYKKHKGDWNIYETAFNQLLTERQIEIRLNPRDFETPTALLCSEDTATYCHRRLVLEYLQAHWQNVEIVHL